MAEKNTAWRAKRKRSLIAAIVIALLGLGSYAVIFSSLGASKVAIEKVEAIKEGMSYKEVVHIAGKEEEKEEIVFDGQNATLYTWSADLGEGEHTVSVVCVKDTVVRVIQTTLEKK